MKRRKTAGELSIKASSDLTKYDFLEVGHALTDDVIEQVRKCGERHEPIFNEEEYCILLIVAGDPLIKGLRRHKYISFLYLPSPRPQQTVFLYNKITKSLKRLWSLPDAKVMATIAEMATVSKKWVDTKRWCDAFYHGWKYDKERDIWKNTKPFHFFNTIRKQHGITMLSEKEYLNAHREELIKAGCKQFDSLLPESFNFAKISIDKIIDTKTALAE